MSTRAWCAGSRRAVPGHSAYQKPDGFATCGECGARLQLKLGCFPNHRLRSCLAPGCDANAKSGGLCAAHHREIVGVGE